MAKRETMIPALKVHQWLEDWEDVSFSDVGRRRKPDPYFFLFSLKATWLRKLSGIDRRKDEGKRSEDTASQRGHTKERSAEIAQFIRGGFPWSTLSKAQRKSPEFRDLKMPGWLSTAIIANIRAPGSTRRGVSIEKEDLIRIEHNGSSLSDLHLPAKITQTGWKPRVPPMQIIDGQHRLLALDQDNLANELGDDYELPVVAFFDLDVTWQAYLFYTINIKPKRINASLAFDLYPLLRTQDWLEASPSRAHVYRETRAQELTEGLWSYPKSPWFKRINMLGESGKGTVTQAAFIRSLIATFVKRWDGSRIGGLFGAELSKDPSDVLSWGRVQQIAFITFIWQRIANAVNSQRPEWSHFLAEHDTPKLLEKTKDPSLSDFAFTSKFSLLASDQGVRAILHVFNDIFYIAALDLELHSWEYGAFFDDEEITNDGIEKAIRSIPKPISKTVDEISSSLLSFEWRNSSAPSLRREASLKQMVYRGSGGYKQLRLALLDLLRSSKRSSIQQYAAEVYTVVAK